MFNQESYTGQKTRSVPWMFKGIIAALYATAVLPPVYIWMGTLHTFVLGAPISAWYTIVICAAAIVAVAALYSREYSGTEAED